jgi:hypothetical protein
LISLPRKLATPRGAAWYVRKTSGVAFAFTRRKK